MDLKIYIKDGFYYVLNSDLKFLSAPIFEKGEPQLIDPPQSVIYYYRLLGYIILIVVPSAPYIASEGATS
jgi:hypothetical protein